MDAKDFKAQFEDKQETVYPEDDHDKRHRAAVETTTEDSGLQVPENKKLYEKKIYVQKLGCRYWYTAEVRRLGFLWRGKWREVSPAMQATYEDAELLLSNFKLNK